MAVVTARAGVAGTTAFTGTGVVTGAGVATGAGRAGAACCTTGAAWTGCVTTG